MFHDIFSKKREKEEIKIKIIIDFREKNSLVPAELIKLNFNIEFKPLQIGDYLINNTIIERKTINDLKSSIINKRIFLQMQEIKQYPLHFLIIEGNQEYLYDNNTLHENAMRGFLISAQRDFQVPILFSNNERETAIYMKIISKYGSKKDISLNPKKISLNPKEQKQYILESFPSIGPIKAKKLLNKFKSLKEIFNAREEELNEILGKNSKEFYFLVHH